MLSEEKIRAILEHENLKIILPLPLHILKELVEKGVYKKESDEDEIEIKMPNLSPDVLNMYKVYIKMAEEGHPLIKIDTQEELSWNV
jgi:hypothetical protein